MALTITTMAAIWYRMHDIERDNLVWDTQHKREEQED